MTPNIPPMLVCPSTEARIVAACLCQREVLEGLPWLEVDDFAVPQHRVTFAAIRHLQAIGEPVEILNVADAIEMRDLENGTHVAQTVGACWLGMLVCDTRNYTEVGPLADDAHWLRTLAERRRTL
jgi:replicative DNA helicase